MQVNQSIPTVFAIIYATNGNLNDALYCAIHAGGDTDTIASMVGAILGVKPHLVSWLSDKGVSADYI